MTEKSTGQSSINDYIDDYRELEISFDRMHLKEVIEFTADSSGITNGIILGDNFIDKYKHDLKSLIQTKTFTKDEIFLYKCNPWKLSFDLYESVEYWQLLLDLNNMHSATEFTQTTVKVYDDTLPDVINEILMSEEVFINTNEDEVNEKFGVIVNRSDDELEDDD